LTKICIIPARGGSKRIPRKNIKYFCGKPIIAYSIEAAKNSRIFDTIMVSTDDEEISQIAKQYGAEVPFMRSEENSDDYSGTGDVVFEVLNQYSAIGKKFNIACCMYATTPFIKKEKIMEAYDLLNSQTFDAVFTVAKYGSPIWRSYKLVRNKGIKMNFPENEAKRSQDLSDSYFDSGQFYFIKIEYFNLLSNKNVFGLNKGAIILDEMEVQDIDTIEDWKIAELKYELIKANLKNK